MAGLNQIQDYDVQTPSKEKTVQVHPKTPASEPQGIFKKVTRLEKRVMGLLVIIAVVLAIATVQVRTAMTQSTLLITENEKKIEKTKQDISKLEQEKSELSRYERVKKIADEAGLKTNEKNTRVVNP